MYFSVTPLYVTKSYKFKIEINGQEIEVDTLLSSILTLKNDNCCFHLLSDSILLYVYFWKNIYAKC